MTAFHGGAEDWERLGLSGAISLERNAAASVRRIRKLADYTLAVVWGALVAAVVVAII